MVIREPWDSSRLLKYGTPTVFLLIFMNTLTVFTLAVITTATMHFKASDDGPGVGLSYLAHFEMRMRA